MKYRSLRADFNGRQISNLVMKLVGEVEPVGESHVDDERYENLLLLEDVLDILIDEIMFVLPFDYHYQYSIQKSENEAKRWFTDKRDWMTETLGDLYE